MIILILLLFHIYVLSVISFVPQTLKQYSKLPLKKLDTNV